MIRDLKLTLSIFMICCGFFILKDFYKKEFEDFNQTESKIIKIDEKTEIRINNGIKHRCTVVDK